ncbi:PucR family transcriptional regulator [Subtercola lobariae]|uniref:PucR family transcriptional regulator n=1 Tax=Subtercola lobariae TaxID=1588641 RepID=A0A917B865_9MICO|nr:helix-turn-helix domain-containing protein [Subtercola lobariae]GGF29125.1 hypothetical protein GCM10011399_22810 [Subtercola lobariae]
MTDGTTTLHAVRSMGAGLPWLDKLTPTADAPIASPASGRSLVGAATRAVSREAVLWAVEVGYRTAERIRAELPAFGEGDGAFEILRVGTESTTLQSLLALAGEDIDAAAPSEALDGVADFVRQGISLDMLLRGIHLGHSGMSAGFLAACERFVEPAERLEQVQVVSERLFAFIDVFSSEMVERFLQEQMRWSTSDAAAKLELTTALLRGGPSEVISLSKRLAYDLTRSHVALIVWSSSRALDADTVELQGTAADLLTRMRCTQRLILPVGAGKVWAWGTPSGSADSVYDVAQSSELHDSIHAAVGQLSAGVEGFRRSHREAEAMVTLFSSVKVQPRLVHYREVDLLSLILSDQKRAREFAEAELGALGADTVQACDLRHTLAVYLDEQSSPNATASRLNISRNTVSYRVHRAEELLGHEVTERTLQMRAALLVFDAGS